MPRRARAGADDPLRVVAGRWSAAARDGRRAVARRSGRPARPGRRGSDWQACRAARPALVPRAQQGDGRRLVRDRRLLRARPDLPASRGRRVRRGVVGAAHAGLGGAGARSGAGRRRCSRTGGGDERLPPSAVVALAWLGVAALPWYAFFQGHPLRIRYMVPLVVASAVLVGPGRGSAPPLAQPPWRRCCSAASGGPRGPFDAKAAMVLEAQWDRPKEHGAPRCHRLPARPGRRRDRDGEHGLARALHAGAVARRLRAARLPARRQRRPLARSARRIHAITSGGC